MRCKPGDTCLMTRADSDPCFQALRGRAIVVVTIPVWSRAGPQWDLQQPIKCPISKTGCQIAALPDEWLTPLKGDEGEHPGDVLVEKNPKMMPLEEIQKLARELYKNRS